MWAYFLFKGVSDRLGNLVRLNSTPIPADLRPSSPGLCPGFAAGHHTNQLLGLWPALALPDHVTCYWASLTMSLPRLRQIPRSAIATLARNRIQGFHVCMARLVSPTVVTLCQFGGKLLSGVLSVNKFLRWSTLVTKSLNGILTVTKVIFGNTKLFLKNQSSSKSLHMAIIGPIDF